MHGSLTPMMPSPCLACNVVSSLTHQSHSVCFNISICSLQLGSGYRCSVTSVVGRSRPHGQPNEKVEANFTSFSNGFDLPSPVQSQLGQFLIQREQKTDHQAVKSCVCTSIPKSLIDRLERCVSYGRCTPALGSLASLFRLIPAKGKPIISANS